jgi:carboxymethylenebutenolidase
VQTIQSGGKTIRIHTIEPGGPNQGPGRHPAVLILHGAGGNVYFWLDHIAPTIAQLGFAVYGIHYFDRTGTTYASGDVLADGVSIPLWIETVKDAIAWVAQQPQVDPGRIALLGVSLGGFIALALGTDQTLPIHAIVDISGGLVAPWEGFATSAFPPTLILHGENDPVVPVSHAHALDKLLTKLQVDHEMHLLPHEGHWFSTATQVELLHHIATFLNQHL